MNKGISNFYWSHLVGVQCVLDLGCYTGDLGKFKPADVAMYGLDSNKAAIDIAKKHYTEAQVWDLDQPQPLPYADNFFDAVVAKDILEHLQKPWELLKEVKRVVRPGGKVLASVITHRSKRTWSDYTHVRGFTMQSTQTLFTDNGFQVVAVWRMGGIPLTARLDLVKINPLLLKFPLFDWVWTSSYELEARLK
jgi:ubiquinone/menaquinone biosynthesis C-methylase UbiE